MKQTKQGELANRIDFNKKMLSILRMGFEYGKDGYNEILVAEELEKLFTQAQQEAVEREREQIDKYVIEEVFCDWDGKNPDFCDFEYDIRWMGGFSTEDTIQESLSEKEPGFYKIRYYCSVFEGQISHPETGRWDISPGLEIEREYIVRTGDSLKSLQKEQQ